MSSENISVYEEYLFAEDKREFLESCKKSTILKQFIRLIHFLNDDASLLTEEDRKTIEQWRHRGETECSLVVIKHDLTRILQETDPAKQKARMEEFNNKYMYLQFYHERLVHGTQAVNSADPGAKVELKTRLTAEDLYEMSTEKKVQEIETLGLNLGLSFDLGSLGDTILQRVNLDKIQNWSVLENIINYLVNLDHSEVGGVDGRT